jgi:hypothetical protein
MSGWRLALPDERYREMVSVALQATFEAFTEVARDMPDDRCRNLDANLNRIR